MINNKINRYVQVAMKLNVSPDLVKSIVEEQFTITYELMTRGDDKPIRLKYFGLFHVKPGRREVYEAKKNFAKFMVYRTKRIKEYLEKRAILRERLDEITKFDYNVEE